MEGCRNFLVRLKGPVLAPFFIEVYGFIERVYLVLRL